ncbi:calcineurin B-like protein 9 isoform X4 [Chenopodium quinoa]|uniref:calcineurin B-like protein 9 isoform X4 n=1 Tax=Chenopodium quinoa TaxID=63459 RepID=UPI000B78BC09|nr:calcineurin B-like protein 9 isoform X4 [Chenopodium quinoa]
MKKIYKKELEPEPIPLTVPGEPVTEDDWTMKTMRKWTRKIKLKMGISKMKKVTEDEVDLLYDLFNKLSNSVVKDGFIQKEELQLALFKNSMKRSLFLDRVCVSFLLLDADVPYFMQEFPIYSCSLVLFP